MKIWVLFSMMSRAELGTSQLIDLNVLSVHWLRAMMRWHSAGPFEASRSLWVRRRFIVSPPMVRLAWEAGMKGASFEGSAWLSK
jgi:hypothetical protein